MNADDVPEWWSLVVDRESFAGLREEAEFALLLRFARAANALRFSLAALTGGEEDGTPATRRQRVNAFLQLAVVICEGVRLARAAEPALRASPAFAAGFGALLNDPGAIAYADDVLGGVAARSPFRFDALPPVAPVSASRDIVFGEGAGRAPGSFYYTLADETLLHAVLELPPGDVYEGLKEHMENAALLAERCAEAADRLIAELMKAQPWQLAR